MKLLKIFQGKRSRGSSLSPSSSMEKANLSSSPASPDIVEKGSQERPKVVSPIAEQNSARAHVQQMSIPRPSRVVEIEEVEPKAPRPSPDDLQQMELAEAFRRIDENGDGHISAAELGTILRCFGDDPTDEELQMMVKVVDADGDGQIDLQEFINLNKQASDRGADSNSDELRAAFHVFDVDKNDQISAEELHEVFKRLGEQSLTIEECCRMISSVDCDGDGFVNFEEFEKMMATPVY